MDRVLPVASGRVLYRDGPLGLGVIGSIQSVPAAITQAVLAVSTINIVHVLDW